jgi:uncharacterized protein YggT (Ycf19 family)
MLFISIAKALVEIAAMCIMAQMVVGLFSPSTREANPIYRLFAVITRPVNALVRRMMPRFVVSQHIPLASLFCLIVLWVCLVGLKVQFNATL